MRRWQTVSLLLILLLRLSYASAQALRQCTMPDGRIVLTNEPCPGEERKAAPPQPVPRKSVPAIPAQPVQPAPTTPETPPSPSARSQPTSPAIQQSQWDELCKSLGAMAAAVAEARDRGVSLTAGLGVIRDKFGAWGEKIEQIGRNIVMESYEHRAWTPAIARQRVELSCVKEYPR